MAYRKGFLLIAISVVEFYVFPLVSKVNRLVVVVQSLSTLLDSDSEEFHFVRNWIGKPVPLIEK